MRVLGNKRNLASRTGYIGVTRRSRLNCTRALVSVEGPPALLTELLRLPGSVLTLGAL